MLCAVSGEGAYVTPQTLLPGPCLQPSYSPHSQRALHSPAPCYSMALSTAINSSNPQPSSLIEISNTKFQRLRTSTWDVRPEEGSCKAGTDIRSAGNRGSPPPLLTLPAALRLGKPPWRALHPLLCPNPIATVLGAEVVGRGGWGRLESAKAHQRGPQGCLFHGHQGSPALMSREWNGQDSEAE